MIYNRIVRPLLFRLDAEKAHDLIFSTGMRFQQSDAFNAFIREQLAFEDASLQVKTSGLTFPNPVGLAAGFDKNAKLLPLLESTGFGFVEVGSITAQAASGNPKPRMFRLPEDKAVINRMGLNNDGAKVICERLKNRTSNIPIGVNIAKTPGTGLSGTAAINDYVTSYKLALPVADYITLNISCPNTGDGKSFEDPDSFRALMEGIRSVESEKNVPLFIKFSADTPSEILKELIKIAESFEADGFIATNTSTSRIGLKSPESLLRQIGAGGLSGHPIHQKALDKLKIIRDTCSDEKTVISAGGIMTPEQARERMHEGANLIQVYTGLVYNGPGFVGDINRYLAG